VGAGGLATGAQIAALLDLGASGAVLGTRFLLSPESLYSDRQRQALIDAQSSESVRTMAFDYARNTLSWPKDVDGRGLRNGNRNLP
jgi:nitronate monooxygenase